MIATKIDIVQSGFELCHKGSLPFFHSLSLLPIGFPGLPSILQSLPESLSILADFLGDAINRFVQNRFLQLALPDDDDRPPLGFQLSPHLLVTFLISCYFRNPEIRVGLGHSVILATLMAVPEAAVDKDDGAVFGENDVGRSWKASINHFVAESQAPECVTEFQLRLCRSGADGDHITMALIWREGI